MSKKIFVVRTNMELMKLGNKPTDDRFKVYERKRDGLYHKFLSVSWSSVKRLASLVNTGQIEADIWPYR